MTNEPVRSYASPPIVEAHCEFIYAQACSDAELDRLAKKLKSDYSALQVTEDVTFKFNAELRQAHVDMTSRNYVVSSDDQTQSVNLKPSSIAVSQRAPYPGWSQFSARVMRDLRTAHKFLSYRKVARIGMRYVNRFDVDINDAAVELQAYLAVGLRGGGLELEPKFHWRVEKQLGEPGELAVINAGEASSLIPGQQTYLLDIDVISMSSPPSRMDEIERKLDGMRSDKNRLFESFITDQARERFGS